MHSTLLRDGNQNASAVVEVVMGTMKALRKPVTIAFALALFTTACGSDQSEVASDDNIADVPAAAEGAAAEESTAGDQPAEGFSRFTFTFSPEDEIAEVYGGDLSTFQVRSAFGSETVIVGFLDATGTIEIPNDIAQETIGIEAEFPDDEFCWWSGFYTNVDSSRTVSAEVELEQVCE